MSLSILLAVDSMKAVVPCALLSSSMVPFATVSLGIGSLSWVLPKKMFLALDNTLYKAYMRLCLFVFENISGVQIKLYGDIEAIRETPEAALVLSNHQSNVDWAVIMMLAERQGKNGSSVGFRVMVKNAIHYVPLFGWYIFQHGYIYVRRFGNFIGTPVLKQLKWLNSIDENYWLLVFPEGTRYTKKHSNKILESQKFCEKMGKKKLENVLCPRVGGIHMALHHLTTLNAVYDVTIGYGQTRNSGKQGYAPGMFEFVCGSLHNRTLSVHIRRYSVDEIPIEKDALRQWIMDLYAKKDQMMTEFNKTGEFPEKVEVNEPALPIQKTLPPTLFFSGALAAAFYFPLVKKSFMYTLATCPLLIIWLKLRKCV